MKKPHIVVVGSANIDLTTFTDVIPRPGETTFGKAFNLGFGGKGANQAVAARLCGADVSMIARVGDDLFGASTISNFESYGIDTRQVRITPGVSSGVAPIFVDSFGQNRILVVKGANDCLEPADLSLEGADMIVVQLEIPLETVYYTLRFASAHGIPSILNPAPGQPIDMREAANADYVVPNETEAEALSGIAIHDTDSARECARKLMEAGLRRVIITLGAQGALCASTAGMTHFPSLTVQAVDTSGAGDAFIGSLACFLASGHNEADAIKRANVYAALSTLSAGTQKSFVTAKEFVQRSEFK